MKKALYVLWRKEKERRETREAFLFALSSWLEGGGENRWRQGFFFSPSECFGGEERTETRIFQLPRRKDQNPPILSTCAEGREGKLRFIRPNETIREWIDHARSTGEKGGERRGKQWGEEKTDTFCEPVAAPTNREKKEEKDFSILYPLYQRKEKGIGRLSFGGGGGRIEIEIEKNGRRGGKGFA